MKIEKILPENCQLILIALNNNQIKEVPNSIICFERTSNIEDLSELYAMSDVFLNLTYEDNYPTTNLEAISCGTPVITYDTGGSPESADDFGIIVKKGDIETVLKTINALVKDQKIILQYSAKVSLNGKGIYDKKYMYVF